MTRFLFWLLAMTIAIATGETAAQESDLQNTVARHLHAIENRNLEALLDTVTAGEELPVIFSDGEKLDTRAQYVDLHERWFADDSWRMRMELMDMIETAELGHALVRYRYTTTSDGGGSTTRAAWLALTFAREDGRWRLVFDQNTPIDAP